MSATPTQDSRADQSAEQRRRKRRERAAKNRVPEPKDIVSGAGQPLDVGVRRELEEQLGHDFSRVRLHTDRDAGVLTDLLGADAVAVGQDIFFREGAFRPGTSDGQRLLAHELLHTVQNPEGLGALRAGRDLGTVSLPQQAAEREAEAGAQQLVRSDEQAPEIEEGQATPGWMRYATVDADRNRIEQIDPATLVDRLTNSVVRSLRGDPEDLSKRTRMQLAGLPGELLDGVLVGLENRLLSSEHDRVLDLVDDIEYADELEQSSLDVPGVESDAAADLFLERETARRTAEEEGERESLPEAAPGPEKEQAQPEGAPGSTPANGWERADAGQQPEDGQSVDGAAGPPGRKPEPRPKPRPKPGADSQQEKRGSGAGAGEQQPTASAAAPRQESSSGDGVASDGGKSESGRQSGDKKEAGGADGKEGQDQQGAPAVSKEESAARNRPGAGDALTAGTQLKPQDKAGKDKPGGSPKESGKDTLPSGAVSRLDGVRNQDVDGPEESAEDDPFGAGSESEVEAGGAEPSAWDTKLQPEDFLPASDLDVSGVPTADKSEPGAAEAALPSFPAPQPTKADKVQAERDAEDAEDAEDAADADLPEPEEDGAAGEPEPSGEADEARSADGQLSGIDVERAEAAPVGAGAAPKDPKSGDDPKAGPVAAQTTVQEAPGKDEPGGAVREGAAKEEKGTPVSGDQAGGAPEKGSQQASGSKSAASEPGAKPSGSPSGATSASGSGPGSGTATGTGTGASGKSEPAPESKAPSAGGPGAGSGPQPEVPAPKAPAPAAPEPAKAPEAPTPEAAPAPEAPTPEAAPAPETAPAPKAAGRKQGSVTTTTRGGGGGGSAAKAAPGRGKKDSAAAPNLTTVSPEAGLSTASKLKPHKALQAMSGVGGAADRTVGDEHKALAAAPPQMQRPAGAPQTLEGKPKSDAPATYSQDPAQKSEAPEGEKAEVEGAKEPEGQIEAEKAEEPGGWDTFKMALGFGIGKVLSWVGFKVDAQELAAKFAGLPTKDEALKKAQAGNAPGVQMQGAAEQTAGEQGSSVDTKGQETVATGRDDAGRPMGENQVYPNAPKEQMKGKVPGADGGRGGVPEAGASTGAVPPEAASEVAEHDRGPQFQQAFSQGQKGMSDSRQTKDKDFRESQTKHKAKVDAEIATNTKSQANQRGKAMTEVTAQRTDWRTEQDGELKKLGTKKTDRHEKVRKDVKDREEKTDKDVTKEKDDGDKKIRDENTKAEKDAEKQRDDSVKDSGNWVSKAFNWLKEKVIEIKNAIVRVIKAARDAVVGFIKHFKETVERWINEARKFIVDTIKELINDLIEFAKAMVRAVIELANRIRKLITSLIAAAIALVNRLAAMLKKVVADLLNAIAKLLSDILNILKKMLMDVIKAVVDAVKTVLDYASKLLSALGDFMLIAVDFLSDPGGWLSGAKNSAVDGAKNHLFREVVSAVKQWFQSKIEEIIGVPKAIIERLIKGGFTLEKIVKETWDAVVPMLPVIIGEIIITKVIAKLIPGAGWAMAVIDAIRTAIGALSEILRAIGAVISWLKVVRMGGAGILFAKAVAAGVVALLELAYEALMSGIGKYVAKVGKRLKGVAAKLGKGGKGDGKAPAGGSDDKGDGKAAPPKTTAAPTASTPKPGTKPGATPGTKPGADKPATTQGPGKGMGTDGWKPTGKGDDKGAPGKQDTSPTPAPKPKPKPEPPAKPKPDVDTKAKPKPKDDARGKSKDDAPGKPKDDKDGSDKPKDPNANKPKGDGKDAPGKPGPKGDKDGPGTKPGKGKPDKDGPSKPKPDKDGPGKPKPDKDGPGGRKPKPDKKGPGKNKPKRDKSGPGRPKSKQDKKNERKEEEESPDALEDRLALITTRIRAYLLPRLKEGMEESVFDASLTMLKNRYRLRSLLAVGDPELDVIAQLNPTSNPIDAVREGSVVYLDAQGEPKFPKAVYDYSRAPGEAKVHFLHDPVRPGIPASKINKLGSNPSGWHKAMRYWPDQIVRMHLIPDSMGGGVQAINLTPAPSRTNSRFDQYVEKPALEAAEEKRDVMKRTGKYMAWYKAEVTYNHPDPWKDFPSHIKGTWNTYKLAGRKWEERGEDSSQMYQEPVGMPRDPGTAWKIRINDRYESGTLLARELASKFSHKDSRLRNIIDRILELAKTRRVQTVDELMNELRAEFSSNGPEYDRRLDNVEEGLRKFADDDRIDYEPLE